MTRTVSLFAGPGGVDAGARILGLDGICGYDIDPAACATAEAAGFRRTCGSVTDVDPDGMRGVTGAVITPPCPTFSAAGKRTGRDDLPVILAALDQLGNTHAGLGPDDAWAEVYSVVQDQRSALVVEALRVALRLPHLQWLVCEQVPTVAPVWQHVAVEMAIAGNFSHCVVVTVRAEDLGLASRRTRTFLIATRHWPPVLDGLPIVDGWETGRFTPPAPLMPQSGVPLPSTTMAGALGWPAGERVNTRGARKTSGGNEFSADGPSWCLTEKARTWHRISDGERLTSAQAGLLVGFPPDYPWQGSRSRQFLQAADVVPPSVAAAVLGAALGIDWRPVVRDYLAGIYPAGTGRVVQPSLFEAAV